MFFRGERGGEFFVVVVLGFLSREQGRDPSTRKNSLVLHRSSSLSTSAFTHLGAPPASQRSQRPRRLARPVMFFLFCREESWKMEIRERRKKERNRCFVVLIGFVWRPEQKGNARPAPCLSGTLSVSQRHASGRRRARGCCRCVSLAERGAASGEREGREREQAEPSQSDGSDDALVLSKRTRASSSSSRLSRTDIANEREYVCA